MRVGCAIKVGMVERDLDYISGIEASGVGRQAPKLNRSQISAEKPNA
jgi:hypothetical protein